MFKQKFKDIIGQEFEVEIKEKLDNKDNKSQ